MTPWIRRLAPKAILIGGIADIVATNVALAPVAAWVFAHDPRALDPNYESTAAFAGALENDPALFTVALLIGSACSVLGGWIAARIAKRDAMLNGAFSAFACLLLSIYGFIAAPSSIPTWQFFALSLLAVALGAFGGRLFDLRPTSASSEPTPAPAASVERTRGHRILLGVNRLLLVATAMLAGIYVLALFITPDEDGAHAVVTGALVVSCVAMTCCLIAARALNGGRPSHWAWHVAAGILTLIPSGLLAVGLWLSARAG